MASQRAASVSLRLAFSSVTCLRCTRCAQADGAIVRAYSATASTSTSTSRGKSTAVTTSDEPNEASPKPKRIRRSVKVMDELIAQGLVKSKRKADLAQAAPPRITVAQRQQADEVPSQPKRTRRSRKEIDELIAKGLVKSKRRADLSAAQLITLQKTLNKPAAELDPLTLPKHRSRTVSNKLNLVSSLRASMSEEDLERVLAENPRVHSHLPGPGYWRDLFPFQAGFLKAHRFFVSNRDTAKKIVTSLKLGERGGRKTTVIEAYPGPGILTRALLDSEHVEKVIAMEDMSQFATWLDKLADEPGVKDRRERLQIIRKSGFRWDSYDTLVASGGLSHLQGRIHRADGSEVDMTTFEEDFQGMPHTDPSWTDDSDILFVAQLPITVHSEQLFAQLVHATFERAWLFRYSRVRMVFIASELLSARAIAAAGEHDFRGKVSVMTQCVADTNILLDASELQPSDEHMFPPTVTVGQRLPSFSPHIGNSHVAKGEGRKSARSQLNVCEVTPRKELLISNVEMDAFDYLTRNLFVTRSKPISEALLHVAPGAQEVLRRLHPDHPSMAGRPAEEAILPETTIWDLTNRQWQSLTKKFELWPFKPDFLLEGGRLDRKGVNNKGF